MNELKIHPNTRSIIQVPINNQDGSIVIQSSDSKKELDQEIKNAMANDRLAIIETPAGATTYFNPKQFSFFHTASTSKLQVVPAIPKLDLEKKDVQ